MTIRDPAGTVLRHGRSVCMVGTHLPFFTVWLKAGRGSMLFCDLTGIINGDPPAGDALQPFLPFVTALAERRPCAPRRYRGGNGPLRRPLGVFSYLGTQHGAGAGGFLGLRRHLPACGTPMVPLTDCLCLARRGGGHGLNYGPLRACGARPGVRGRRAGMRACWSMSSPPQNLIWVHRIGGSAWRLFVGPRPSAAGHANNRLYISTHGGRRLAARPQVFSRPSSLNVGPHSRQPRPPYYIVASIAWQAGRVSAA